MTHEIERIRRGEVIDNTRRALKQGARIEGRHNSAFCHST